MSLITPDFGLIFWMVIVFALVFFILAKFGFPAITKMVDKRTDHIESSLKAALEAQEKLSHLAEEQAELIHKTQVEQGEIIKEATRTRDAIIADAKEQATKEAAKIVEQAKLQIEEQRQGALRDIRTKVALLSVEIAEKVVRKSLSKDQDQIELVNKMFDEIAEATKADANK